ncbi:MAG TPA: nitroreductase family protein [Armatimonadota bacterium]|nr:nitroreductase family protein [Armatimonadota bacterium]
MDFADVVRARYSCRAYEDRPVEDDKLQRILEAARLAPSASNRQEWRFVVVRDAAKRQALVKVARDQAFVGQAPIVIAACAKTNGHVMSCGHRCDIIDVAIALEHIALAAANEGLGTCWIGAFFQDKAKELLGIPDDVPVIELMTLGYPADSPKPKSRLALDEIVMYDAWRS